MSIKAYIRPSELTIPEYQRDWNKRRSAEMAKSFDPEALGALTGARRSNGTIAVIDGRHRKGACHLAGYDEKVLVIVHEGLTLAEEARLFLSLNDSKAVSAVDKHRASVIAEDELAVSINNVVIAREWEVHKNARDGRINAISRVYSIVKMKPTRAEGLELLDRTLAVITTAWGHDREGVDQHVMDGVAKVLHRYPEADIARLIHVLQAASPRMVRMNGINIATLNSWHMGSGVAHTIVNLYNNRLRTHRLADWVWKY